MKISVPKGLAQFELCIVGGVNICPGSGELTNGGTCCSRASLGYGGGTHYSRVLAQFSLEFSQVIARLQVSTGIRLNNFSG